MDYGLLRLAKAGNLACLKHTDPFVRERKADIHSPLSESYITYAMDVIFEELSLMYPQLTTRLTISLPLRMFVRNIGRTYE